MTHELIKNSFVDLLPGGNVLYGVYPYCTVKCPKGSNCTR